MNYTFRLSIRSFFIFILIPACLTADVRGGLDSLSQRISSSKWTVFKCRVVQNLGNDIWQDDITITSRGLKRFEVNASDQVIRVVEDTVWTCLLKTKQVTVDRYFSDAPNVFHFLTGNFEGLEVIREEIVSDVLYISFMDNISGYSGKLLLDPGSYLPEKLIIIMDADSKMEVFLEKIITGNTDGPEFFEWDESWSVLDLRE